MKTKVLVIDPQNPDLAVIREAADLLRRGGLVAFPTETVYGLGANALDAIAVRRIFAAKGRPANNPLIVHGHSLEAVAELATTWPAAAIRLAAAFWPGSLTMVLPKSERVPLEVTADGPTVALRVPAHPVALALLRATGMPVAAPSANRSGGLSPTLAEHVLGDLHGHADLILDAGPTPGGLESTVVDLTSTPPRLLRPGLVAPAQIEAVIGPIERPQTEQTGSEASPLRSPGMLSKHYAPHAPLECVRGDVGRRVQELLQQGVKVGWLTFEEGTEPTHPALRKVALPCEPARYAAQLYAVLHQLDSAEVDQIIVTTPPETEEWLAVLDRLRRAAQK